MAKIYFTLTGTRHYYGSDFLKSGMKNKLEELRKEKNLSQEEFSSYMKVSRQTIISIEKERYNPSLDLAFRIADFFERRIEDIFIQEEKDER